MRGAGRSYKHYWLMSFNGCHRCNVQGHSSTLWRVQPLLIYHTPVDMITSHDIVWHHNLCVRVWSDDVTDR